jgi:UDP-N-acetylglucosamine diphosphorylase/glucosamine-1-phosphate N-acetyltransferase
MPDVSPVLFLFEDRRSRAWEPFALTRPAGELRFGAFRQRGRSERALGIACRGYLGCPELAGFDEPNAPPVLLESPATDRPRVMLSSRAVLEWQPAPAWPAEPATILVGDTPVGWYLPAGTPNPDPAALHELAAPRGGGAALALRGRLLRNVWDLVVGNSAQLARDFEGIRTPQDPAAPRQGEWQAVGFQPGLLRVGKDVTIEPNVVFDFSGGPIWLQDGVSVRAFTRLAGPASIGCHSILFGGLYTGISTGPHCKLHGEMEESVVLGYSNKAHQGFLGHAYLGHWVNLGAMTTNSDLKNNYGPVKLWTPRGTRDTKHMKMGCLLGDHVKTAIGIRINTGTVIGAASNIFGSALITGYIRPFSWGTGESNGVYDVEKFLETAQIVMRRRGVTLTDPARGLLRRAFERGRTGEE